MKIDYVKVSPSENMTVLVTNFVPTASYPEVAQQMMAYEYVHGEQLGFMVAPRSEQAVVRLEMSGGEFCGNGVLAAAAYSHYQGLTKAPTFLLEASGVSGPLECKVEQISSYVFEATGEMPPPLSIQPMSVAYAERKIEGQVVEMDGISHFLTDVWIDTDAFPRVMQELMRVIDQPAIGIISYRPLAEGDVDMRPFVAVLSTGSQGFERSCGSGSVALGVALASETNDNTFTFRQPGGKIHVTIGETNTISTTVRFTCEGTCMLDG